MSLTPRLRRIAPAAAGFLLLSLAACNTQPENIVSGGPVDDQADALAHAKPVELPPAIAASKTYRCHDNSVVSIDWFAGAKSAQIRVAKASPVRVSAEEAGKTLTADGGYSVSGSADASSAEIGVPGHPAQTCKS